MEILSRMPAPDVLKCRRVCRRWRDLISTQHFQEMHLKAKAYHSSMILFNEFVVSVKNKGALLLLDRWEKRWKIPTIRRSRPDFINSDSDLTYVQLSHDGLIVMRSILCVDGLIDGLIVYSIFNPISGDEVRIKTPDRDIEVYGMFFNPLIKEYCILFLKHEPPLEFQVLNLGAQPCLRTLKQSVSFLPHNYKGISSFEPPVVIDDGATIYWLVDSGADCYYIADDDFPSCEELILTFDIKTEEFNFIPHPHPIHNCEGLKHKDMHIMKIDGSPSFVQSTTTHDRTLRVINIWTLKDSATQLWIKTYSVSIDISLDINRFWRSFSYFKVLAVRNGEMLLQYVVYDYCSGDGGVCVYNLQLGTLRRIGQESLKFMEIIFVFEPSFVSLRNCKPIIRI